MANVVKQISSHHAKMNKALAAANLHSEKIAGFLQQFDGSTFKASPKNAAAETKVSGKKNKEKSGKSGKAAKVGRKSRKSEG